MANMIDHSQKILEKVMLGFIVDAQDTEKYCKQYYSLGDKYFELLNIIIIFIN